MNKSISKGLGIINGIIFYGIIICGIGGAVFIDKAILSLLMIVGAVIVAFLLCGLIGTLIGIREGIDALVKRSMIYQTPETDEKRDIYD